MGGGFDHHSNHEKFDSAHSKKIKNETRFIPKDTTLKPSKPGEASQDEPTTAVELLRKLSQDLLSQKPGDQTRPLQDRIPEADTGDRQKETVAFKPLERNTTQEKRKFEGSYRLLSDYNIRAKL